MLLSTRNSCVGARMAMLSPMELLDWLGQYQFLSAAQGSELRPLLGNFPDCHSLCRELVKRDWLTPYQVNQILQGNHENLVIGSYRLRERLGEGAMGQVFKAWNLRMERVVAIKMIHKGLVNNAKAMERFRRELHTAAKLDHPNIALVRDADEVEGKLFLVMDYIEGLNLSQRVKQRGPLPIQQAVEYARQTALGLQYASDMGIVHRDIKPGNLIASSLKGNDDDPVVKILDFGLARYESEHENSTRLTQVGNLLGTVDYVAPEQAQNASTADIRADIYSLGCTLYYLLTGQPPFLGSSVVEKIGPRLTGEPPSVCAVRPEVPAGLDELLRKMMARRPGERFQTPLEAAEALQAFIEKGEAGAQPGVDGVPAQVPMAQLVLPQGEGAASAGALTEERPFYASEPSGPAEAEPSQSEDPAFADMTATGRDMSGEAPPSAPAVPKVKKQLPLKLALVLGGAAGFFLLTLCLLTSTYLIFFSGPPAKTTKGALKIIEAKFSVPSQTLKAGENKFILVTIARTDFTGQVKVMLKDLPRGVSAGTVTIPKTQNRGELRITVSNGTEAMVAPILIVAECEAERIRAETPLELKIVE
jgi:tRNA A-37 threonylcarbamoyl transferase component Bud32